MDTVVERSTTALRVTGSIPTRNKNLYGSQVIVPGLGVVYLTFLFVNAPTIQELFLA